MTGTPALTTTQRESAPTFVAAETHRLEPITIQSASIADAERLYDLITNQLAQGHLLPRELPELKAHATRFFVATADNVIVGCGDLAPLSPTVAEIRSLVVEVSHRGMGVGTSLIKVIIMQAHEQHFSHLCAFTHEPAPFVQMGFSVVPHLWIPEKVKSDCLTCDRFRRCEQRAMRLNLRSVASSR